MSEYRIKRRKIVIDENYENNKIIKNILKYQDIKINNLELKITELENNLKDMKNIILHQKDLLKDKLETKLEKEMCDEMRNAYI